MRMLELILILEKSPFEFSVHDKMDKVDGYVDVYHLIEKKAYLRFNFENNKFINVFDVARDQYIETNVHDIRNYFMGQAQEYKDIFGIKNKV